ncbi:MAG: hypothetical protein KGM93_15495 [Sphingomonadales bacterium]|nr:hypothetical protein [Sphingomonadales bacterium]
MDRQGRRWHNAARSATRLRYASMACGKHARLVAMPAPVSLIGLVSSQTRATACHPDGSRVIGCGTSRIVPKPEIGPDQVLLHGNIDVGDRNDTAIGHGIGRRHRQSVGA